jgi:hypothetical protein
VLLYVRGTWGTGEGSYVSALCLLLGTVRRECKSSKHCVTLEAMWWTGRLWWVDHAMSAGRMRLASVPGSEEENRDCAGC